MSWKPRIIVVTADPEELLSLSAQLLGADYDVVQGMSIQEAEDEIGRTVPHLIIMDPGLKGFSAESLDHMLKRFSGHAQVPMLYLIGKNGQPEVADFIREGVDDTISRPVSSLELTTRCRSLLRNRQLLGQIRLQEIFLRRKGLKPFSPHKKKPDVLVLEDAGEQRNRIAETLTALKCTTTKVDTPREALELVTHSAPDMVILDILFPEKDGFDLCRYLKGNSATRNIPLLMLTAVPELDNRILGLDFGPDDYLVKPAADLEIQTRIRRLLTRKSGYDRIYSNFQTLIREDLADPFSGYAKEEYFTFYLPEMLQWSRTAVLPLTISVLKLRSVADLQLSAQTLNRSLRGLDTVFRTGDLELVMAFPETPLSKAKHVHQRILSLLENEGLPRESFLMGSVSTPEDGWEPRNLIATMKHRATVDEMGQDRKKRAQGEKVLVLSNNGSGAALARTLFSLGLAGSEAVTIDDLKEAGSQFADILILESDKDQGAETLKVIRSLPMGKNLPILWKLLNPFTVNEKTLGQLADDYVPHGVEAAYLAHRARQLMARHEDKNNRGRIEGVLNQLVALSESGDPTMRGHANRVAGAAVKLGMRLNLSSEELDTLRHGSHLHDIGKIFVPDSILKKRGMLDPEEYAVMKSHPKVGSAIVREIPFLADALPIIKLHHERADGGGYPEGLVGDQIPLLSRIVTVVDIYDSLITSRSYRPRFSREEAADILLNESEQGMWDSYLVDQFMRMINTQ
ncbi:MAG TPA: response regulator [Proteobacteria bacterium]|nr:cyclic di-GMP phosphodiesterase response regulator RpfG [bacterium BMS3Abin14]HDL53721.1 response regulator [Pseudomonadota bacterium]